MCRSIKRLRPAAGSDDPTATPDEIEAAVQEIAHISTHLLASLQVGARSK